MNAKETELIAEIGKFSLWKVRAGQRRGVEDVYEVRRGDEIIAAFDDEREARAELELQDRMEVQGRAFGPGM